MTTPRLGSCCAGALTVLLAGAAGAQTAPPRASVKVDSATISGLGARNIGSAAMSGRIAALAAVHEGPRLTVYVGAASGGVWKSVNGGTTFKPVFDKQAVQSIGAVTIDPKNPKVIWVGSGEAWTRNSASIGDGVYKSTDGGDNWSNLGLRESERIAKILVDPTESNTVYVCVPGNLWSDSDGRVVDRARREQRQGTAVQALGAGRGQRGAVQAQRGLRLHRGGASQERAVSLRGRRQDLGSPRSQPAHDLAAFLLREPDRRPEEREQDLQAGPVAHRQHRRGNELQQHRGRLARRLPRRVGRSHQHRPPHRRRRRRPVVFIRCGQQVVEGRQSSRLAVLPRQRGHGPP